MTYDLPVKKNYDRNQLRLFLKTIGCGLLQQSVWVTPYNPTKLIEEFIEERDLGGMVLVSSLGKDGTVNKMDLIELVENVYKINSINEEYRHFLEEAKKNEIPRFNKIVSFLTILQNDPQLPFELLPSDWLGEKAFLAFQRINS